MGRDAAAVDRAYTEQYEALVKRNAELLRILRQMEGVEDERADREE
jgi:hypothetical protein